MVTIDGAMGEGGGQILRSALALAVCLGKPVRLQNIRATRKNPGLQPQHLAAVNAAAAVSHAAVEGATIHSRELVFRPGRVRGGDYQFCIGTAGSTTLLLQTVLPALILADAVSTVLLEGGTHNPLAPPFEYLHHVFLPLLNQMGPQVAATLERPGFAPKGGGRVRVRIQPVAQLRPLELIARGKVVSQQAEVLLAHLPEHIAQREIAVLKTSLGWSEQEVSWRACNEAYGPGNVVYTLISSERITECCSAVGQRGVPAEDVAQAVVRQTRRYLASGVPVGEHLADQLLLPMALAGSGSFVTLRPSLHALTNIEVIRAFLPVVIQCDELAPDIWQIRISPASA
jgi:RNA 3'-terminal phosphate cyclase (ATP)